MAKSAEKIEIGLSAAFKGWGISAFHYDNDGNLINSIYSNYTLSNNELVKKILDYSKGKKCPFLYFEEDLIFYMGFPTQDSELIVLGPVSMRHLSAEQLYSYKFKYQVFGTDFKVPHLLLLEYSNSLEDYLTDNRYSETAEYFLDMLNLSDNHEMASITLGVSLHMSPDFLEYLQISRKISKKLSKCLYVNDKRKLKRYT